ncbi:MAG: exosortase/archaeosortase family protein, partial [Tepidisphaeraceae bacterium]
MSSVSSSQVLSGLPAGSDGAGAEPLYLGLRLRSWLKIGTLGTLMAVLFWPNLRRLFLKTNPFTGEPNWGHAVCIPVIGLYYLYVNRDELLSKPVVPLMSMRMTAQRLVVSLTAIGIGALVYFAAPLAPNGTFTGPATIRIVAWGILICGTLALLFDWGLATLVFGILVAGYGIYPGRNDTLWDYGMVLTLFGVVLLLCGWEVMKIAWFPIAFLVCAIPFPGLVYSKIAGPLQQIAAEVAVFVLNATGVDATQSGTKIQIGGIGQTPRTLNVAEACAGLRSLMTFISVAAAVAFLSSRPLWQKFVLVASAIPIAIFCNVMRVAGQGLLDHYVSRELSENF